MSSRRRRVILESVPQPEVLIIGAGAAGLACARTLTRAGVPVTILEARQRLGGRLHTLTDPLSPVPVELGAEFVHGRPPEIWQAVETGRLAAIEMGGEFHRLVDGELQAHGDDEDDADPLVALLPEMTAAPEQSFAQFVANSRASEEVRQAATGYVEGFEAARADTISIRGLVEMEQAAGRIDGDRIFRLAHGYGALAEWLWAGVDSELARVYLGAVVERIGWRRGRVEAGSSVGEFSAPRAVVTLPLGVLEAGAVAFAPEPAALRDGLAAAAMGHAIRMVLRFRRPVWEDREELANAGFLFSTESWFPTWWTSLPLRTPVLTGWMAGTRAESAREWDEARRLTVALGSLSRLLQTSASTLAGELEAWHTHDWSADPFSRGAYSYPRVGGTEAHRRFGEPVEDTLYFAGEAANADGHSGTVHGAIATGVHAARRILQVL